MVIKSLPGYPGNITYKGKDTYWVEFTSPRSTIMEELFLSPWLRKLIWRLPCSIRKAKANKPYGLVIGINENGKIFHNLQDESGKAYYLTSAIDYKGEIWLGSNKSN